MTGCYPDEFIALKEKEAREMVFAVIRESERLGIHRNHFLLWIHNCSMQFDTDQSFDFTLP